MRAAEPHEWSVLMVQGQAGDKDAYHRLLLGITPYLRTIASRAHRNASDAEDTVQDILLTLHQVRQTYDPSRPFKPWLAGIARHRVADRLRALGRVAAGEVVLDTGYEALAAPYQWSDGGLDRRAIDTALLALPAGQRQAITLLKLQERSLKEASEQSGMSITVLKVAAHRGIKALRQLLRSGEE